MVEVVVFIVVVIIVVIIVVVVVVVVLEIDSGQINTFKNPELRSNSAAAQTRSFTTKSNAMH